MAACTVAGNGDGAAFAMSSPAENQSAPHALQPATTRTTRATFSVECRPYGLFLTIPPSTTSQPFATEPTPDEIGQAVANRDLEPTPYSDRSQELTDQWVRESGGDLNDLLRRSRQYHARRIAYLVVHRWTDPIVLDWNEKMIDGTHRLKAARHLKLPEVEVLINPPPAPSSETKCS